MLSVKLNLHNLIQCSIHRIGAASESILYHKLISGVLLDCS
jgi:hypothetical protein